MRGNIRRGSPPKYALGHDVLYFLVFVPLSYSWFKATNTEHFRAGSDNGNGFFRETQDVDSGIHDGQVVTIRLECGRLV